MLNRDDFLNKNKLSTKEITVAAWDDTVLIRELTIADRTKFFKRVQEIQKNEGKESLVDLQVDLVLMSVIDQDGERLFDDSERDLLLKCSGKAISNIADQILTHNGMDEDAIIEAEKN